MRNAGDDVRVDESKRRFPVRYLRFILFLAIAAFFATPARAQGTVTVNLGSTYANGVATFTTFTQAGGVAPVPVMTQFLTANGTLSQQFYLGGSIYQVGNTYTLMVCKSNGTVCLFTSVTPTNGTTQDVTTALNANPFGGSTGGGTPGGTNGQLQYNNGGVFGGFTLSGDCTLSQPNITCTKVNGVAYGTSPSTNTVPVVTGTNTVTYEAIPNAALASAVININSTPCTLGSSCTPAGASVAWDAITNPTGNMALSMGTKTSIFSGTAATNQFFALKNATAAVVGTSQGSEVMSFCGRAFHGSADVEDCMTLSELPGNGNDAAIGFTVGHTGTSTGVVTTTFPGPVASGNDGVHAGYTSWPGSTANFSVTANSSGFMGPTSASFTAYALQMPNAGPAANTLMCTGALASAISPITYCQATVPMGGTGIGTGTAHGVLLAEGTSPFGFTAAGGANFPLIGQAGADPIFSTISYPTSLTSGAVLCGTSTTAISSGAILNTNILAKGGGAGACPTNSLTTDDGTSSTYTGTGGTKSPVFTSTGTTAGFHDYPQGTTSAAVAPCNVATSICEQAPSSVTSYLVNKPGVSANGITTNNVAAAVITQGISGDANHSVTVTTGSGTSVGSTTFCSSANCPAGTYAIFVYLDITTACGTTGTYVVNLIYTDDQGAKTVVVNLNGAGAVPATGVVTTTSTANFGQETQVIRVASGNLNYSTTAVSCGTAGPMVGKLYISATPVM